MTVWPTSLPAPALNTLQEAPPSNLLRSTMDKGPAKVRRRTTANVRKLGFSLILTPAQLEVLDTFFETDTFSGSETFDYTHPRTGNPVTARFVEPPSYSEHEQVSYTVNVSLEIMP